MENAADALKMAGAVLIFVLAISVAIFAFGQVRETADTIIDYKDRETVYIDGDFYYESSGTERVVGLETAIPAITRAYLENYIIVFSGLEKPIYKIKVNSNEYKDKYVLDLETSSNYEYNNVTIPKDKKADFLCAILYGKYKNGNDYTTVITDTFKKNFSQVSMDGCKPLYEQLKGKQIIEHLGVYYQNDSENTPEANKTEKRIITYVVK